MGPKGRSLAHAVGGKPSEARDARDRRPSSPGQRSDYLSSRSACLAVRLLSRGLTAIRTRPLSCFAVANGAAQATSTLYTKRQLRRPC